MFKEIAYFMVVVFRKNIYILLYIQVLKRCLINNFISFKFWNFYFLSLKKYN